MYAVWLAVLLPVQAVRAEINAEDIAFAFALEDAVTIRADFAAVPVHAASFSGERLADSGESVAPSFVGERNLPVAWELDEYDRLYVAYRADFPTTPDFRALTRGWQAPARDSNRGDFAPELICLVFTGPPASPAVTPHMGTRSYVKFSGEPSLSQRTGVTGSALPRSYFSVRNGYIRKST